MDVSFSAEVFCWRGPAPYYFIAVPEAEVEDLREAQRMVTYGWGMIPARVSIGATTWTTSLWPRKDGFVVPLKQAVRRAEDLAEGSVADVVLTVDDTPRV